MSSEMPSSALTLAIDVDATALAAASHAAVVDAWRASRADPDHPSPRLGPALCDALDRLGAWTAAVDVDALCDAFGWEAIPGVVPLPDALRAEGEKAGADTQ